MNDIGTNSIILIAGASGLIGSDLCESFRQQGIKVKTLTTGNVSADNQFKFHWNTEKNSIDERCFEGVTHIINLSGANIAGGLWTKKRRKIIYRSRVEGTKLLFDTAKRLNVNLQVYIGASASGFYGGRDNFPAAEEEEGKGKGFLSDVCADWETEHRKFEGISKRVVIARLSNVLSDKGGFLIPFRMLSKLKLRLYFSKGVHFSSWIHIDDVIDFINRAISSEINGVFNLSGGEDSWCDLQKNIYKALGKQYITITLTPFILKLMMGKMSELMLTGNLISNKKLKESVFVPKFTELNKALFATMIK